MKVLQDTQIPKQMMSDCISRIFVKNFTDPFHETITSLQI
jgi:hypothetical protein